MSKRSETRIALEKFLREGKAHTALIRDARRRPILIPEALIDFDKVGKSGRAFYDFGRRLRVLSGPGHTQEEVFVVPVELVQISRDEPASLAGLALPFGTIVHDQGLWLKFAPGFTEAGVNDRGEILILAGGADAVKHPEAGPVRGAVNTAVTGRSKRLVARATVEEQKADRAEADAWMRALLAISGGKPLKTEFKSAGIGCSHLTNDPHLHQTAKLNFYEVRNSEMLRIESLVKLRFRKARRDAPHISVYSLTGLPKDQTAFNAFLKAVKTAKKDPVKLGVPAKLTDSRFYDPQTKGIAPATFGFFASIPKSMTEISVLTINSDYHGEVRSRGLLSPLMSVMAMIDVLSARATVAVLNKAGTATSFMGSTGSGKSTAGLFWAEKNEKYRRAELRRRYEMDLRRTPDAGRLGEAGIQKELDRVMGRVGIVCQEDWIEILKEGAGHWVFWPTEKAMYARTGGFPGLSYILAENHPMLENAAADFGGSGETEGLGRVNHQCATERFFYDPEWNHLQFDHSPRMISATLLLDRTPEGGPLVRRVTAREAIDWMIMGRGAEGRFEPLQNPYPDFCALLMQMGVVGEKLVEAYQNAQRGDFTLMGGGDAKLGEAIYDRFDLQVKLWLDNCREVPTFIVHAAPQLEMMQDVFWALSEHPELFGGWKQVGQDEFQRFMSERYGVTYSPRGEWLQVPASARRA